MRRININTLPDIQASNVLWWVLRHKWTQNCTIMLNVFITSSDYVSHVYE